MDDEKVELFKQIRLYLGTDNWEKMKETSESELLLFKKFDININKSYYVKGNQDILNKFKSFYLTRCLKKHPLYTTCSLYEYAEGMTSADKDEYGLSVSKDLLFLYMHKHGSFLGNSRVWLTETVINRIADRNRKGLVTVILSEMSMTEFEDCGEMDIIDLGGSIVSSRVAEACKEVNKNKKSSVKSTGSVDLS